MYSIPITFPYSKDVSNSGNEYIIIKKTKPKVKLVDID